MEMSNRNKKVNKKSFSVFMVFALLLSLFAGCTGRGNSSHKTLRVAVVQYTSGDNFIDALTNCMKEQFQEMESEDLNIIMTVRSGDNNQSTQDKVVEEMIDAGCDILCVDLVDRTSPSKIIRLAEDAGIPVIFFNRELVREDLMRGENLFYVGGDAAQSGVMQGELAAVTLASNPHYPLQIKRQQHLALRKVLRLPLASSIKGSFTGYFSEPQSTVCSIIC